MQLLVPACAAQRGSETPLLSPVGCPGSPSPRHDHFCQHCPAWGPFAVCREQEGRSCPAISQCPPGHEQSGGEKTQGSLLTSPSVTQELWKEPFLPVSGWAGGVTGPSVSMGAISETHQGQALKSWGSVQNSSGVLEVGVRHLPLGSLQLILYHARI